MLNKNDEIICKITGYTSSGDGVAKHENFPLFIPGVIIGETVKIKVLKNTIIIQISLKTPFLNIREK